MQMLRFIATTIVLLLCAGGAEPSPGRSTRRLSEADAGGSTELHVGDKLKITLPGSPTTGFQWEVSAIDTTVLRQLGEQEFESSGGAVGGGGKFTLRFDVLGTGQMGLKLVYHRPFEKDVPPAQAFETTLTVV